uniref:Uncharacterized protein n=1 Tax=Bionectria ochroleuca TaxID=29856 RepID=A0A8H7K454_BIOOC
MAYIHQVTRTCARMQEDLIAPGGFLFHTAAESAEEDLTASTIVDNGGTLHVVNNMDLLIPGTYRDCPRGDWVKAGSGVLPVQGYGTRLFSKIFNGPRGPKTVNLTLEDTAFVDGFHLNIVSEAKLHQIGLWVYGLDATLRHGSIERNPSIVAQLVRKNGLTFLEYKPYSSYPAIPCEIQRTVAIKSMLTYAFFSAVSRVKQRRQTSMNQLPLRVESEHI